MKAAVMPVQGVKDRESGKGKAPYPRGARAPSWDGSGSGPFETGPAVGLNVTCALRDQVEWLGLAHSIVAHETGWRKNNTIVFVIDRRFSSSSSNNVDQKNITGANGHR